MPSGNAAGPKDHKNMTLIASDSRPIRSTAARPAERRPLGRWMLGSPLYSLTLGHRSPKSFFAVAPDPWPGDPTLGQRLVVGEFAAFGVVGQAAPASPDPPWQRSGANPLWLDALNGFAWLRDLRDCGDPSSATVAVRLVDDWTDREWRWSPSTWKREVLAQRMVAWIRHFDWLAAAADPDFSARFVFAVARPALGGQEAVLVLKALIFADLAFIRDGKRYEKSLAQSLSRLAKFVKRYVLHDGVVAERAPHIQMAVLRHLLDVRAALASADRRSPAELVA